MPPASGQPAHPPVFRSSSPTTAAFTSRVHCTGAPAVNPAAGAGAGLGVGVGVGVGVGTEGSAGVGAADAPRFGTRTMNASRRLVPAFAVHTKYSPVTSMLPLGSFE